MIYIQYYELCCEPNCTYTSTFMPIHSWISVPLAPSNIQVTDLDETTATLTWTAPIPNIVSPLSPILSYQLILSTEQNGLPNVTVSVTTNFHKFLGIEEFTVYTCIIAAMNGVGLGQFSSPVSFTTSESSMLGYNVKSPMECYAGHTK